MQEEQYIKGFNAAYLLCAYEPQLIRSILNTVIPRTTYVEGLCDGKSQFEFEKYKKLGDQFAYLRKAAQERGRDFE